MAQVTSTTPDLMGIISRQITPDVIRNVAAQLSEDRGSTASALSAAVPSTLTALSDVASSDTGARHLKDVIDEKRLSASQVDDDRSLFPSAAAASSDHAATLIDDELGPRSNSIAAAVASATGVKADSAHKLIGGVASVAVAALAKSSGGMGAGALQSMFREQRGRWVEKLPGPVASLFNGHAARPVPAGPDRGYEERAVTGPAIRELEAPRRNWIIPVILVALALLAIPLVRGLRRPAPTLPDSPQGLQPVAPMTEPVPAPVPTPPAETAPAPAAEATPSTAAEPGSLADMVAYLEGSGETTPHAFAPSPLTFAFASARPTRDSMGTIDDVAVALNAHPGAMIRVESHTDDIGTPESNLNLSQARADSIKSALVDRGVDGTRIETAGMGQDLPIASNDTPEGRAKNRRSEIVVTAR
jgi:OmpA-OmpF porin, OOP family